MSEPLSFFIASSIVAVVGALLAFTLVPPNRFFGFRTAQTLKDRELWFRANRFAGCSLLAAAAASLSVYLAYPGLSSGRSFIGLLVFAGPLVVALAATFAHLRKTRSRSRNGLTTRRTR